MLPILVDETDTRAAHRCRSEVDAITAIGHVMWPACYFTGHLHVFIVVSNNQLLCGNQTKTKRTM